MLRYDRQTKPGLVALYDIRPGNGAGPFLQPRSPHRAKKCLERRKHRAGCNFHRPPSRGRRTAKFNQIQSPTYPVWWKSVHTISSYCGNKPTHKQRLCNCCKQQTGPIKIHCAAKLRAQCNKHSSATVRLPQTSVSSQSFGKNWQVNQNNQKTEHIPI